MNIHEFRNTLIRVSYTIYTQRTYNALETHMKREFAGQIRGRKCILTLKIVLQITDFDHLSFHYKQAYVKAVLIHTCLFYALSY